MTASSLLKQPQPALGVEIAGEMLMFWRVHCAFAGNLALIRTRLRLFRHAAGRVGVALLLAALTACATAPTVEEEIAYSPDWFSCNNRFSCVVVYDAFCTLTAVNARSAIVYQDWSRQDVIRRGERSVCPPPDRYNEVAGCVQGRCTYPLRFGSSGSESP